MVPAHNLLVSDPPSDIGDMIMNCEAYGSMLRLRRVAALVCRAAQRFKAKGEHTMVDSEQLLMARELSEQRSFGSFMRRNLPRITVLTCGRSSWASFSMRMVSGGVVEDLPMPASSTRRNIHCYCQGSITSPVS